MPMLTPFSHPLYVMAKPVGSRCNLVCRYCYYLEKGKYYLEREKDDINQRELYAERDCNNDETDVFSRRKNSRNSMSDELLERFIETYINAQTTPEVLFTWHGGEPLLQPLHFYRKAIELQQRYAGGRTIDNCIQTNGTLLTEEWCRFLHDNNFLVGVSIDGPRHFHDPLRQNSFEKVMRGIEMLDRYDVQWNAMATVNSLNVEHPVEFYRFFRNMGCRFLQFTPIVERRDENGMLVPGMREGGTLTDTSVTPRQWGRFLCAVFDEWLSHDVGELFVQIFEATVANYVGVAPGICSLAPTCGHSAALEHNGDLYCCDHFVFPEYKLGNISDRPIAEMMYSEKQRFFGRAKHDSLPRQCRECRFLFTCHGECPKNRFIRDSYGNPNLNYLCEGYRMFFSHSEQQMLTFSHEYAPL